MFIPWSADNEKKLETNLFLSSVTLKYFVKYFFIFNLLKLLFRGITKYCYKILALKDLINQKT